MAFVALKRLKWGDRFIEIGEPVPEDEPGRNYNGLLLSHSIAGADGPDGADQFAEAIARANADRDAALKRVADLEGTSPIHVPDGITPGETPGWPIDAVTGGVLALTDEQRQSLEADGISGEAIVTHQGDIVRIESEEAAPANSEDADVNATAGAIELAEANGIDLATVEGTGQDGRITQPDVQKLIDAAE